ncbi:hypothetical protein FACS1894156_1220 [Bacteroidia bacterium]|nr:hypothetical protein FACS1894156_1220 [Bacteroidia bacterium]
MKNNFFIAVALCVGVALASCDDSYPELPPKTQNGDNTFGCLVNGELVVPNTSSFASYVDKPPVATYYAQKNELQIVAYTMSRQTFFFSISNPQQGVKAPIDSVLYTLSNSQRYSGRKVGEMELSRFDAQRGIVSGEFKFDACPLSSVPDSCIKVTLGRFDIQLTSINN